MLLTCKIFGCKPSYHCSGVTGCELVICERCGAEVIPYNDYNPSLSSQLFKELRPYKGLFRK